MRALDQQYLRKATLATCAGKALAHTMQAQAAACALACLAALVVANDLACSNQLAPVACLQAPDGASLVRVAYLAPVVAADALGPGEDDCPSMAAAAFEHSEPLLAEPASPGLHHLPNVLEGKASALRRRQ